MLLQDNAVPGPSQIPDNDIPAEYDVSVLFWPPNLQSIDINMTAGYSSCLTPLRAHNSDATPLYGLSSWLINAPGTHATNQSPVAC
jgi:hypothetical protein